jgi:hypothetical protein
MKQKKLKKKWCQKNLQRIFELRNCELQFSLLPNDAKADRCLVEFVHSIDWETYDDKKYNKNVGEAYDLFIQKNELYLLI